MNYSDFGLSDFGFYLNLITAVGVLFGHYVFGTPKSGKSIVLVGFLWVLWLVWMIALGFFSEIRLRDAVAGLLSYCVFLFVFLSDLLRYRIGARLTALRGEKWVKEIDYLYLALGGVGLLISIGQLNAVADKISVPGTFAVLAVASALVLRAIKTRAEIGSWNKLPEGS
jgi:hypothetical protein